MQTIEKREVLTRTIALCFPLLKQKGERKIQLERDGGKPVISEIADGDPTPEVQKECKFGESQYVFRKNSGGDETKSLNVTWASCKQVVF